MGRLGKTLTIADFDTRKLWMLYHWNPVSLTIAFGQSRWYGSRTTAKGGSWGSKSGAAAETLLLHSW